MIRSYLAQVEQLREAKSLHAHVNKFSGLEYNSDDLMISVRTMHGHAASQSWLLQEVHISTVR